MSDTTDEKTNGNDDVSWEDAFREMAEATQSANNAAAPSSGPSTAGVPPSGGIAATASTFTAQRESGSVDIDFLLDLPLDVSVEVGRCKMLINELLQLQQGSVIQLEKMVGEPFEVYVNRKLMAFGEVVVVNEKFGIRLTDVIDPKERIQQLG